MQRLGGASRAIFLAAIVAGCGTGVTSRNPSASAPPLTPSAPSPTPNAPTPTPSGPVALDAGFPDAGTYTTTVFRPRLTFRINDNGWRVLFQDDEDELALEGDSGDGMAFLGARVSQVVGPSRGSRRRTRRPRRVAARSSVAFAAAAPVATTVDSRPATSIDVTNEKTTETDIFYFPTGSFHIQPGVRLRFIVVPMDGPDLVIYMGGPVDQFDAAMARTKPMLDSLQIGD